jgi:hypothetical protein
MERWPAARYKDRLGGEAGQVVGLVASTICMTIRDGHAAVERRAYWWQLAKRQEVLHRMHTSRDFTLNMFPRACSIISATYISGPETLFHQP